jgi:hypothetical protein
MKHIVINYGKKQSLKKSVWKILLTFHWFIKSISQQQWKRGSYQPIIIEVKIISWKNGTKITEKKIYRKQWKNEKSSKCRHKYRKFRCWIKSHFRFPDVYFFVKNLAENMLIFCLIFDFQLTGLLSCVGVFSRLAVDFRGFFRNFDFLDQKSSLKV